MVLLVDAEWTNVIVEHRESREIGIDGDGGSRHVKMARPPHRNQYVLSRHKNGALNLRSNIRGYQTESGPSDDKTMCSRC